VAERGEPSRLRALISLFGLLFAILLVIYIAVFIFHYVPQKYSRFLDAAIVAIISYIVIRMILGYLNNVLARYLDKASIHPFIFVVRMVGYFIMAVATIAAFGIDVSSIILGSTFLAAVLGLATQSVLANQFAGLLLIVTKPFKIGDRVWIHAWQFSIQYPVIFPKYFSSDLLYNNGFAGTVLDISINYTTLRTQGGEIVRIANNVLTQGAYRLLNKESVVQVRYEIPKYLNFVTLKAEIENSVSSMEGLLDKPSLLVDETTLNTYVILIKAKFETDSSALVRSKILENLISIVEPKRLPNRMGSEL